VTLKRVQVVLDTERDADLLRWLDQQPNRSAAVRRALRKVMRPQPRLDAAMVRRIVREELAEVRVVAGNAGEEREPQGDLDPEAAALLDAMF
jgi:hypothetical protein